MPKRQLTIAASVTRNYGPVSVTYSASEEIEAEKYGDVVSLNQSLTAAINASFDDFEANTLPKMRLPSPKGIQNDSKPKAQWFIAKEMYMTIQDGKKYYFIRTANNPRANKYGAAVYFDRFEGLNKDQFEGQLDRETFKHVFPDGMRVLIEEYNGKPRAIQIAHKDQVGV